MQLALDLDESAAVLDHQSAGGDNPSLDGGTGSTVPGEGTVGANGTAKGRKSRASNV